MAQLAVGDEFGGCRIEGVLGAGGMGVVYRASDLMLERPVAIKLIAADRAGDSSARRRFEREARLMAGIDHPNVIPVYAAGEQDGNLYLVMRFVDGTDLQRRLREDGALAPAEAARIVAQVAQALDAAHGRGLVHRDIKPANVLLAREHVYLTDFGITRLIDEPSHTTETGAWIGTVDYTSPEHLRGEATDARSDIYSLGCVLYACLTGVPPFSRTSTPATITAHLQDRPPLPSHTHPGLARAFDHVIGRALAKDPGHRYTSAGELGEAALAAAAGKPMRWGRGGASRRDGTPELTAPPLPPGLAELRAAATPPADPPVAAAATPPDVIEAGADEAPTRVGEAVGRGADEAPTQAIDAATSGTDETPTQVVDAATSGTDEAPTQVVDAETSGTDETPTQVVDAETSGTDETPTQVSDVATSGTDETPTPVGGAVDIRTARPERTQVQPRSEIPTLALGPGEGARRGRASAAHGGRRRGLTQPGRGALGLLALLVVLILVTVGVLVSRTAAKRTPPRPFSAGQIHAIVDAFAANYSHRSTAAMSSLLAPDVLRIDPSGSERGRSAVLADYSRQFRTRPLPNRYAVSQLVITSGWVGRASGRYSLVLADHSTLVGTVTFAIQRIDGRAMIALIATQQDDVAVNAPTTTSAGSGASSTRTTVAAPLNSSATAASDGAALDTATPVATGSASPSAASAAPPSDPAAVGSADGAGFRFWHGNGFGYHHHRRRN